VVRDGLPTEGLDLPDDLVGRRPIASRSVGAPSVVVDHDGRAPSRHEQGDLPADPSRGACHHRDLVVKHDDLSFRPTLASPAGLR